MNVCIQVFSEFNLKYCDNDISHVYVQTMDVYRYMNLFSVHSNVDTYIYILITYIHIYIYIYIFVCISGRTRLCDMKQSGYMWPIFAGVV